MSKADKMFEDLGMKMKHSEHYENGKLVENIVEFKKITNYAVMDSETTLVSFNLLVKRLRTVNEHRRNEIEINVATNEKMKELGWINE